MKPVGIQNLTFFQHVLPFLNQVWKECAQRNRLDVSDLMNGKVRNHVFRGLKANKSKIQNHWKPTCF